MEKFDLIVIGGGPAGYLAAERASEEKMNVLLIEKEHIGGVCLNEGCIPSKTLLYSAKILDGAKHGDKYGIIANDITIDHKKVIKRKEKVVKKLVGGIKLKLKKNKVTLVDAVAHIEKKTNDGYCVSANGNTYIGDRLLIATGSNALMPPIPGVHEGFEKGYVLTNREILSLDEIPENLVVVGGGVIGLEMASYYCSVGSNVTVIEMLDHIAGQTDLDISKILKGNLEKKGITFELNAKVTKVEEGSVTFEKDGKSQDVKANKVLLSIGRRANTNGLGLENIGVETDRGAIKTDRYMKTNIPEVYAAGDINGKSLLAHTAYREAEVAVNNMLGKKDIMRYSAVPAVIYTNPEVSGVGETEATAKEKGINFECHKLSMMFSGRYVAEHEGGDGIAKILIEKETRKLIGVHMIGNPSSEIIYGVCVMIENEMRVEDVKEIIFPHPTVSEIIREGIFEF